jgi:hypothetical protein
MTDFRRHDETRLVREILRAFGARPGIRLFRNSVGMVRLPDGGAIPYGLCPGSSDLIGWRTLPSGVAQFVALEVKTPAGRLTRDQGRFLEAVRRSGGVAAEIRSLGDVEVVLGEAR